MARFGTARAHAPFLGLLALAGLAFASSMVGPLDRPLISPQDPGVYAFTSHYLSRNLTLWPVPQLDLLSDWSFYPYGTSHAFLHWGFERDLFGALLAGLDPRLPFFQLYFLISLALTTAGAYVVLNVEHGRLRATLAALAVSFGNVYAIRKFPGQLPYACPHWLILGVLLDGVLVRRLHQRRGWPLDLLILRLFLLAASFGLDLGYFAGFSATSFILALLWSIGVRAVQRRRAGACPLPLVLSPRSRPLAWAAGAGFCLVCWLFLPLSFQVARAALAYDFGGLPEFAQPASPARLLRPHLPGLEPERPAGDRSGEWGFPFQPGLAFVLLGAAGVAFGRQRVALVPCLVLLGGALLFDPFERPFLNALPWFQFARVPGRATAFFPAVLALCALELPAARRWPAPARLAGVVVAALALSEAAVAYAQSRAAPQGVRGAYLPDERFWQAMEAIDEADGAALFHWPFSVSPDRAGLGIFARQLGGVGQLARYHHKKVSGGDFGRVHPRQLAPLVDAGWPYLFLSDSSGAHARRQRRDFMPQEWRFLERFLAAHDFCGILLFPDLLPAATVRGFHRRFGAPLAELRIEPGPGRVQFLKRSEAWPPGARAREESPVVLIPPRFRLPSGHRLDLGAPSSGDFLREGWKRPFHGARSIEGSGAKVELRGDRRARFVRLQLAGRAGEAVAVAIDGERLGETPLSGGRFEILSFPLTRPLDRRGSEILISRADGEERPLAVRVKWIELAPAGRRRTVHD